MRRHLSSTFAGLCLLITAGFAFEASAAPSATATETFRSHHTQVSELTRTRAKTEKIEAAVDGLLDYHALAVDSLGGAKRFSDRCAQRCDEFEALLARLIRENYMRRVRTDKDHKVTYVGEETRGSSVRVKTHVEYEKDGRPVVVEVTYVMHEVDNRWLVRDIITDGVSLARNYKYEFNQLIKKDGIDGLVARLETKLGETTMVAKAP